MMQHERENEFIFVEESEGGERLDKILAQRYQNKYSRSYFESLIEQKLVLVNGEQTKKRSKLDIGDEIEVQFLISVERDLQPEAIALDILYEDEHLLIVNKPAGMVVHPAVGNWSGTFVNALLYHCKSLPTSDKDRPGIVHRLDKETSGILMAAKTAEAHQKLAALFASRKIYKEYKAIAIGNPSCQKVEEPIGRHPIHRQEMAVIPKGRFASTSWKTLAFDGELSLVQISILTGRTHQIRVHMKHRNVPVLGDSLYGNESWNRRYGVKRQLLHASLMSFSHPISNEKMEIFAPFPPDMQFFVDKLSPFC